MAVRRYQTRPCFFPAPDQHGDGDAGAQPPAIRAGFAGRQALAVALLGRGAAINQVKIYGVPLAFERSEL